MVEVLNRKKRVVRYVCEVDLYIIHVSNPTSS
jgi:hypothetical protein